MDAMNSKETKMKRTAKAPQIVGSIHLYGTSRCGHGWIARRADGQMFGDGEPKVGRSATEAIWLAADALRQAGCVKGLVEIHYDFDFGPRMAVADINHVPYFGSLTWQAAPVYEISAGALLAVAQYREGYGVGRGEVG